MVGVIYYFVISSEIHCFSTLVSFKIILFIVKTVKYSASSTYLHHKCLI